MRDVANGTENTIEQLWRQVQYAQLGTLGIALQVNSVAWSRACYEAVYTCKVLEFCSALHAAPVSLFYLCRLEFCVAIC